MLSRQADGMCSEVMTQLNSKINKIYINKYSICLRHISSNKTTQRRITLYMNIKIT